MKSSITKFIVLTILLAAFQPGVTYADNLRSYCSHTQSDDCIQIDDNGFWWDSEPGLPAKKTNKRLSIKKVGKTRIARLDGTYYCTHSSMQVSKSYLKCSISGWTFSAN